MLTMCEEIVLLALDEKSGELRSTKEFGVECALVGAASLDLALSKRIAFEGDTVKAVGSEAGFQPMSEWMEEMFATRKDLQQETLQSLMSRGVLSEKKPDSPGFPIRTATRSSIRGFTSRPRPGSRGRSCPMKCRRRETACW
jgi:hypothetical protein